MPLSIVREGHIPALVIAGLAHALFSRGGCQLLSARGTARWSNLKHQRILPWILDDHRVWRLCAGDASRVEPGNDGGACLLAGNFQRKEAQSGGSSRRGRRVAAMPGVHADMVVIAACRDEERA